LPTLSAINLTNVVELAH